MKKDFTELLCFIDDSIKVFEQNILLFNNYKFNLSSNPNLNKSEMMTIILEYSSFNFNCFKDYYKKLLWRIYILQHRSDVKLASYKRLNRLMKGYLPYCTILLDSLLVNCHELSVVDFTSVGV